MTASANTPVPGAALRTLLSHAIDYAGLFPPAQLDMPSAANEYASYLLSDDVWALGRFVVPAGRLDELAASAAAGGCASLGDPDDRAGLSVVIGADVAADAARISAFQAGHGTANAWWTAVVAVELRATTPDAVGVAANALPASVERFVEIPIANDPTELVRAIGRAGAFAKVRTGGTTADAFPSTEHVARFLATCVREGVPFKATAGLHHPFRGDYRLTYEAGSACGRMYGFLNVFLATAALVDGFGETGVVPLLEEHDSHAVHVDAESIVWRGHRISVEQLVMARSLMRSIGSCSFREPIDELTALELL